MVIINIIPSTMVPNQSFTMNINNFFLPAVCCCPGICIGWPQGGRDPREPLASGPSQPGKQPTRWYLPQRRKVRGTSGEIISLKLGGFLNGVKCFSDCFGSSFKISRLWCASEILNCFLKDILQFTAGNNTWYMIRVQNVFCSKSLPNRNEMSKHCHEICDLGGRIF